MQWRGKARSSARVGGSGLRTGQTGRSASIPPRRPDSRSLPNRAEARDHTARRATHQTPIREQRERPNRLHRQRQGTIRDGLKSGLVRSSICTSLLAACEMSSGGFRAPPASREHQLGRLDWSIYRFLALLAALICGKRLAETVQTRKHRAAIEEARSWTRAHGCDGCAQDSSVASASPDGIVPVAPRECHDWRYDQQVDEEPFLSATMGGRQEKEKRIPARRCYRARRLSRCHGVALSFGKIETDRDGVIHFQAVTRCEESVLPSPMLGSGRLEAARFCTPV